MTTAISANRWEHSAALLRNDTPELNRLRLEVRGWLEKNTPAEWRYCISVLSKDDQRTWHKRVAEAGYAAPHWPACYGGLGASLREQLVIADEWARAGAPPLRNIPMRFLAPGLMKFGTDAQKAFFLPRLLSGEIAVCQLYSEAEAGSDLGSLRTSAAVDGDVLIVNGTKLWSTGADQSDWGFALVRTGDQTLPGSKGLSMLLIDLATPGIRIRPIPTIYGEDEFCEVVLDNIAVPRSNLLGALNQGWLVSNEILAAERLSSSHPVPCFSLLRKITRLASRSALSTDPAFEDRLAKIEIDLLAMSALYLSACEAADNGAAIGTASSVLKARVPDILQQLSVLLLEAASVGGESGSVEINAARLYLQSRRSTIYGGTAEIQRNIIAQRILGLPAS